jgi:flagellar motor switch protein FliM
MSEDTAPLSVLRRKAGARPGPAPAPRGMTPEKALRQALAKGADALPGLDLVVTAQGMDVQDQADMIAALPPVALFTLADGPGEARGLVCLDPAFVDALIEVQTMGRVDPDTRAPRATTRIDAALTRDFIEGVLSGFHDRVAPLEQARWAHGFRYGTHLADASPLPLMLEEGDYRILTLKVDLGGAVKSGRIWLALPAVAGGAAVTPAGRTAGHGPKRPLPPADPIWTGRMKAAVSAATVDLAAVLLRTKMPLDKLRTLKPGDVIPVPRSAMSTVELHAAGGRPVLRARLGQQNGMRAVRLTLGAAASVATAPELPRTNPEPALASAAPARPNPLPQPDLPDLPALP